MSGFYADGKKPQKQPLSQASGKKKLLVGIPVSLVGGVMWALHIPFGSLLFMVLGAYALVGLVEVLAGSSLTAASERWDRFPGWKKFLIGTAVVGAALIGLMSSLPLLAAWLEA